MTPRPTDSTGICAMIIERARVIGRTVIVVLFVGLWSSPIPAAAQFSDSYNFLKAVRDRDGSAASRLLDDETSRVINTRDSVNGETGLLIAVRRRDETWTKFLLEKGANPSLADKKGMTPLMHATLLGFVEGAKILLKRGALANATNDMGETALILAVHNKNTVLIRLLMKQGANPDKTDYVAGLSARDYARRDDRTGNILALLDAEPDETIKHSQPVFGPN